MKDTNVIAATTNKVEILESLNLSFAEVQPLYLKLKPATKPQDERTKLRAERNATTKAKLMPFETVFNLIKKEEFQLTNRVTAKTIAANAQIINDYICETASTKTFDKIKETTLQIGRLEKVFMSIKLFMEFMTDSQKATIGKKAFSHTSVVDLVIKICSLQVSKYEAIVNSFEAAKLAAKKQAK